NSISCVRILKESTMEETISKINDFLAELEILIGSQLHDYSEVNEKFKEGKELIDELEEVNEKQHGLFRYIYHAKYSDYSKKRGNMENARKHEKLAKKYEKFRTTAQETNIYETNLLFTDARLKDAEEIFDHEKKILQDFVKEELEKIKSILQDEVVEQFRREIEKVFNATLNSFLDFRNLIELEIHLCKLTDGPITGELFDLENVSTDKTNEIEKARKALLNSL
ncbi:15766_t:CDS:1, partial [Acaulospora morrowiae]